MLVEELIKSGAKFEYNEERHEYKLNGVIYPSVSQIFDHFGLIKGKEFFKPEHSQRGTFVHEALALYNANRLNLESLDTVIKPYVDSWIVSLKANPCKVKYSEVKLWDEEFKVFGTCDMTADFLYIQGHCVCDYKTGMVSNLTGFQLAAYAKMLRLDKPNRYAIKLDKTGRQAKLVEFNDDNDYKVWEGMARLYHWKKANGYMEPKI